MCLLLRMPCLTILPKEPLGLSTTNELLVLASISSAWHIEAIQ